MSFKAGKDLKKIEFKNKNGLSLKFLENGALFSIDYDNIMINQVLGNPLEGSLNNIYLRVHSEDKISFVPILGPDSNSEFSFNDDVVCFKGEYWGISYKCVCALDKSKNFWVWSIDLVNNGNSDEDIDVIYTQDIAIADRGAVRNNEAYTSQYIDHYVIEDKKQGYVVCSRQNQEQTVDGKKVFPWIAQGCFNKAEGFVTDGFDFFGTSYKNTNIAEALVNKNLCSKVLQYEFAFIGLQSQKVSLEVGKETNIGFYASFEENHGAASSDVDLKLVPAKSDIPVDADTTKCTVSKNLFNNISIFNSIDLSEKEVQEYFSGDIRHKEEKDGKLLSFFYDKGQHVVLKEKELNILRPHGHVLVTAKDYFLNANAMCSTPYMYGLFNSHITLGNTSFNKLLSISRNHLNILKANGQRIFVKQGDEYKLLGIPSAFEIGINYCKWIYKSDSDEIVITSWVSSFDPACFLDIQVKGEPKELLIANNIVAGVNELDSSPSIEIDNDKKVVKIIPSKDEMVSGLYPENTFYMVSDKKDSIEVIGTDELLFSDGITRDNAYVVIKTKEVSEFSLSFTGYINNKDKALKLAEKFSEKVETIDSCIEKNDKLWQTLKNRFKLNLGDDEQIKKFNDVVTWYCHNAMIHYSVPHGLEQYSGAAWGTRDVCQGPMELFISNRSFEPAKEVLRVLFSHQFKHSGDWPQWFMFDKFVTIQCEESHGDIIVWPLKALGDYIEASNDFSVLEEEVPYTDAENEFKFTKEKYTILEHAEYLIETMISNFIPGTSLSCYGDGDWDDTLQPANAEMRKQMVSGWTVSLTYQVLKKFALICQRADKKELSKKIEKIHKNLKQDYNKYVIKDKVAAGFVYFNDLKNIDYMLHPKDKKTGINYRLLPMTRSMISELFTKDQMEKHWGIIKKELYFPDGVHLMNTPAVYTGGTNKYFKRAETASNFGREIGLQYVHAHIRFIEAMAKIGNAEEVYKGFLTINPITISDFVKCAQTRQSNAYFSSSDGDFRDRYEAKKKFLDIKDGKIPVKGGWRIYSSGPGIYINQIISNMLGIRDSFEDLIFDPVLPDKLDGLEFDFGYKDKLIKYKYHIKENNFSPSSVVVNGTELDIDYLENPYRKGGAVASKKDFEDLLKDFDNVVDVYL